MQRYKRYRLQCYDGTDYTATRGTDTALSSASRSAQAAVIKAIREGKTNVDLNIPETPDGGGDGDGDGTTGDQETSGGNTGGEDGGGDNVSL